MEYNSTIAQSNLFSHIMKGYEEEGRAVAAAFLNEHGELSKSEIQALKNTLLESMYDTFGMTEFSDSLSIWLEDRFSCFDLSIEDRINEAFYHGVDETLAKALEEPKPQVPSI